MYKVDNALTPIKETTKKKKERRKEHGYIKREKSKEARFPLSPKNA